jgi:excisionase family DNA binding protein
MPLTAANLLLVEPRYLTQSEAAEYLRVSVRWLREATSGGEIPAAKVGRKLLYTPADLDAYVDRQRRLRTGQDLSDTE